LKEGREEEGKMDGRKEQERMNERDGERN